MSDRFSQTPAEREAEMVALARAGLKLRDDDPVHHPAHYTSSPAKCSNCGTGIECIDVTETMSFSVGNAVKYLWRVDLKGSPITDLEKSRWYIDREIERRKRG